MIPSPDYRALDAALRDRGVELVTSPDAYARAHELPGWYAVFRELTPVSVWLPLAPATMPDTGELAALAAGLPPGAAVVKDWVKSRKYEWDTACFVPDLADTAHLTGVAEAFVRGQDEFLTGGVVLRAYEDFTGTEARVWWVRGEPVLVTPHPDTPEALAEPEIGADVRAAVAELDVAFVTTDLALRADGRWRVVEVGDGQVSDRAAGVAPELLLEPLLMP
ncbi:ATP-grasp domain-containing protein [Yinghuangia soli]|uniref:ATP-grasp domain-containing protein n=1 Tax=Yinghuangia soli TaxID=2908204 RepID=A0AA41PUK2_9ACTN|nr:ATP-grasp domain-containing protein [Yinghuangia soli]MCF2525971.1 ATP-grasp domain-containing protein [Yinghuangia soli]